MSTLTAQEAADFLNCRSVDQFRREVRRGVWPAPIAPDSRPQRWSQPELEAALRRDRSNVQDPALAKLERSLGLT